MADLFGRVGATFEKAVSLRSADRRTKGTVKMETTIQSHISAKSNLDQAWETLIKLQISKGFPKEFWSTVERIRSRKWIQVQDIDSLVSLIDQYESKQKNVLKTSLRHRPEKAAKP
jgi:hypothetical protein